MNKFAKSAGLVIAGIIVGLLFSTVATKDTSLGGVYQQVISNFEKGIVTSGVSFVNALTQTGGTLTITQTGATRTITEQELIDNNIIEITAGQGAALTLTLPATSTMVKLLSNSSDMREWFIDNQHAAATTTTIAAGAGIDLIAYTTNDDVIDGLEVARLTCWRKTVNRDVYCLVSENLKAD